MKYVGTSQPVHDAKNKVTGHLRYTADMKIQGMAHLKMIFSPIAHGYVKAIHTEKAMELPGVYGVFHCFNTTSKKYNRYRSRHDQTELAQEERIFQNYVRYVGDRVAAVAAKDMETAKKAAKLVEIEYEELPSALNFEEALDGKNCINDKPVKGEYNMEIGKKQEEQGLLTVETTMELARLTHVAMEPHACIADYDAMEDILTIYSPNQAVYGIRTVVADLLEMPYSHVHVKKAPMGGSFGAKQEWILEPVAACVARELKRPVKLVFSRKEVMTSTIVRGAMKGKVRSCFTPDGELKELYMDVLLDAGAYVSNSLDYIGAMSGKFFRIYKSPYVEFRGRVVSTNTPVSGAFRSWSAAESAAFVEHNFNQAAKKLGIDPILLRRKNIHMPGEIEQKSGLPVGEIRTREVLSVGYEKFQWEKRKEECRQFNAEQKRWKRGIGMACAGHGNSYLPRVGDYSTANLKMEEDGSVTANVTLHDHGCGTVTAMKIILADALEIPMEKIYVTEGDTSSTPYDMGCFASRTTFVVGRAVYDSAMQLKEMLLSCAEELYQIDKKDLSCKNGRIQVKDKKESFTYEQVVRDTMTKLRRSVCVSVQFQNQTNPCVTGAHFALAEVDTWTGSVKVLDYLAVHDIGKAINREMCIAQIQGASVMGMGAALGEKMEINKKGEITDSLKKYCLINAPTATKVSVELIEDGMTEGAFGLKSIGEVSYAPAAPCVCAAVNDALGSNLSVMPLDLERIIEWTCREDFI